MPIFEYVCRSCQHAFELIVQGSKRPRCPSCGAAGVDKQLSVFATAGRDDDGACGADFGSGGGCGTCGDPDGPCA